jgi:AI-2 transport protein TqsA
MSPVKLPFYVKLAMMLVSIVLILFLLMQGKDIFIPMVFALLISVLLYPLSRFMERRLHFPRSFAAILSIILFIAAIGAFIYFLSVQVVSFSEDLPEFEKRLLGVLNDIQHWIWREYHVSTRQQTDYINKSASSLISTAANSLGNIFLSFSTLALWTIFTFIYTFFMIFHRKLLLKFVLHLFNPKDRDQVQEVIVQTRGMINGYVTGLLIEMLIISIVSCATLLIMGIKYAILLGLLAAVLNIIPYIGIYTSIAIGMLVTFANSGGNAALGLAIAFIVIHLIDSNVLMPRIVGSRVKMNPFITIVAVLIGEFVWGIPGMFLFIPITGILKLICERVDGLQAWAILIGVEEKDKPGPPKIKIEPESSATPE